MPIVIPSKNIFGKENQKVIDNEIEGVSFSSNSINLKSREVANIYQQIYAEESGSLLWRNYLQYSSKLDEIVGENLFLNGQKVINGINCVGIGIRVKSDRYIYVPNTYINLSMGYKTGESYVGTTMYRPALYSNSNLSDAKTAKVENIKIGERRTVVKKSAYINEAACELYCEIQEYSTRTKSKDFVLTLYLPTSVNPFLTEQSGVVDSLIFTDFQISVVAEEIEFSSSEKSVGKEKYENIQSNEFFQDFDENKTGRYPIGTFFESSIGKISATDFISQKIIEEYKNGKETAKIMCSISDYYDENEKEKITVSKKSSRLSFDIGDEVIPMVFSADGVDRPMSRYKGGSAKVFRVCGLKFIYDGAVWQELTLQEV